MKQLLPEHLLHVADFPFHFPLNPLCGSTVLQVGISNGVAGCLFDFTDTLIYRSLHFIFRARFHVILLCVIRGLTVAVTLDLRAESTHEIDDNTYQYDQPQSSSAEGRSAKVKTAAAEHEKKNN